MSASARRPGGSAKPPLSGSPGSLSRRRFLALTGAGSALSVGALASESEARAGVPRGDAVPRELIFLHGYTTPTPDVKAWRRVLRSAGLRDVRVSAPVAASGPSRVDPFNPRGLPSWFRYATDNTGLVPIQPDRPNFDDVYQSMYESSATSAGKSLWTILQEAATRAGSAEHVTLVGESQGGIMAMFLGIEWNRQQPAGQLGALGMIRSAPDPQTWQPRPRGRPIVDDPRWHTSPPAYRTRFPVVLGGDDDVFPPFFSLAALAPLLTRNALSRDSSVKIGVLPDGNTEVHLLPGVSHYNGGSRPYEAFARLIAGA